MVEAFRGFILRKYNDFGGNVPLRTVSYLLLLDGGVHD